MQFGASSQSDCLARYARICNIVFRICTSYSVYVTSFWRTDQALCLPHVNVTGLDFHPQLMKGTLCDHDALEKLFAQPKDGMDYPSVKHTNGDLEGIVIKLRH